MGRLNESPIVKIAKKFSRLHSLTPPVDIETLIKKYASLTYKDIPISGVDGVSLNLKRIGKNPKVVVNSNLSKGRQNFTLAHELGHIIIPWHIGTIADHIYSVEQDDYEYFLLEQEANHFAAEILMPSDWIVSKFNSWTSDLKEFQNYICAICDVSFHAASVRMIQLLPKDILYVAESGAFVKHSGKTLETNAIPPNRGDIFKKDIYPYVKSYSFLLTNDATYHWFALNSEIKLSINDDRPWREILDSIANDLDPVEGKVKFKGSINGIISFAHGKAKREADYSVGTIISSCIYRLTNREYNDFVKHPEFENFISARAKEFYRPK